MSLFRTFKIIFKHPLTKNQRVAAYMRWLRWQVGSRLHPGGTVVDFVGGTRLLAKPGMTGATGNIYCGLHECDDMGFVLHFLRKDDLFLDVGANIGSYTVLASGAVGAKTISFEPVCTSYQHLLDNVHLNRLVDRVTLFNVAVGSEAGEIEMMADQDTTNRVLKGQIYSGAKVKVPVVTLDGSLAGRTPKLIKIDTEGFETEVLRGAVHTLENPELKAVLLELNGSGEAYGFDEQAVHGNMIELGFQKCSYNVLTRKFRINADANSRTGNQLYVRDPDSVQVLLSSAKRYPLIDMKL